MPSSRNDANSPDKEEQAEDAECSPFKAQSCLAILLSGSLEPQIKTDMSFKTFLGRGSGESIQTSFSGNGFVVIQPYEEVYFQAGG